MKKKLLYFLISITLFTLMGCSNKTKDSTSNNSSNIQANSNSGITYTQFSLSDNSYFYCPFLFFDNSLIFNNPDENNKISIISNPLPKDILQSKDIKDFANYSSDNMVLVNETLYFADGSKNNALCSLTIPDKTYLELNKNSVHNLIAVDDQLFYLNKSDNNKIYKYDTTNNRSNSISSDSVGSFIISGDFIIYENLSDNSKLYSIKADGSSRQKLTDYTANSFVPFDGELLFFNSSDNNNLYSMNPTTLECKRIYIMNGSQLKIINNTLYFINGDDGNYLYSLSVDLQKPSVSFKPYISESINKYFLTPEGIFYEKGINVNNIYYKSISSKS